MIENQGIFLEFLGMTIFPDFPVFPDREIGQISRFPTGNWKTGKCASLARVYPYNFYPINSYPCPVVVKSNSKQKSAVPLYGNMTELFH